MQREVIVVGSGYAGMAAALQLAPPLRSVSLVVGNGAAAGAQIHRSLRWPELIQPVKRGGDAQ